MSGTLAQALGGLDLRPGQVYRETVNGLEVEVNVRPPLPKPPEPERVEPYDGPPMVEPWVELPWEPTSTVTVRPGPWPLPDPPVMLDDEGVEP